MKASRLQLEPPDHAGLALYKYLKQHDKDKSAARELLKSVSGKPVSEVYKTAFKHWKESLEDAVFLEATTVGPLAIGLGNASPLENGLSIHHTYGTPYLPGSALKGLVRRAADRFGLSPQEKAVLLGEGPDSKGKTPGCAAHLVFWDGWLDPQSTRPYQLDVITVHHPEYYGKRGAVWPTDFDDPNPVSFLSVKPGTKFCLALSSASSNSDGWAFAAAEILKWGLENLGLGGKTNAGYGYFEVKLPEKPKSETEVGEELYQTYKRRIEAIKGNNAANESRWFIQELQKYPVGSRKRTAQAILEHLDGWGLQKEKYYQTLKALLEES